MRVHMCGSTHTCVCVCACVLLTNIDFLYTSYDYAFSGLEATNMSVNVLQTALSITLLCVLSRVKNNGL